MKIIYYSPHPTHDIVSEVGYATHQREVIIALKALGHTVIPVIMGGSDKANLSPAGIPASKKSFKSIIKKLFPRFLWTSLKDLQLMRHDKNAAKKLEEAILEHRPDLVYERSEYLQDKGVEVIQKYKIRYFLEINAPFIEEMNGFEGYSIWHGLAHKKERNKNNAADKIFVVSSALKHFLIKKYKTEADKMIIQPNCINIDKIHVDALTIGQLKKDLHVSGKQVVGFVGSIFPHHGVDILIDAFEIAITKEPDLVLLIVGDGTILDELKERVKSKSMVEHVVFTGKQNHDEIYNFIALMDICVMAKSNWYGSPIKIFEYGAMGKPIIAPNTIPVQDVMKNRLHGLLVEMNKDEVAGAIINLMENKPLAESMAANFRELVLNHYIWNKAALKIIEEV